MALLEHQLVEGKTGEYNMIYINCEIIDKKKGQEILEELILSFEENIGKSNGKKQYLNLEKVKKVDLYILSKFGHLNKNKECPEIILYKCNENVKKELTENDYDSFFNFVDSKENL